MKLTLIAINCLQLGSTSTKLPIILILTPSISIQLLTHAVNYSHSSLTKLLLSLSLAKLVEFSFIFRFDFRIEKNCLSMPDALLKSKCDQFQFLPLLNPTLPLRL